MGRAMPVIELVTLIEAPIERVFDLARSLDLHMESTAGTGERAVGGVTTGLLGADQEVTWRAKHLGVWQHLTSRMTAFEPPNYFRDSMVRGAFKRFNHDHHFERTGPAGGHTRMRDVLDFTTPLGLLGWIADGLFLTRYMRGFLQDRNRLLRATAEGSDWRKYLA